ncbi:unnamed protein product [Cyprideis torosa]|uniref:Uncharacterized protein n=1 Tax=Cyprideis torosa TaxID=163714 RepID=A0A7R8WE36_9CRUS|nr:unnamed protein product [Cyprideis torosa]CAG0889809.1 unnamed protein product [Cyprideis torosa]
MHCLVLFSCVLSLVFVSVLSSPRGRAAQYTAELVSCYRVKQIDLATCLKTFLVSQRETLRNGIRELDIPPLEPAKFPHVNLVDNGGWEGNFTNILVSGITTGFTYDSFNLSTDLVKGYLSLTIEFPSLFIEGNYGMTTYFLQQIIPMIPKSLAPKSIGVFSTNLHRVTALGSGTIRPRYDILEVKNLDIDFDYHDDSSIELVATAGSQVLTTILNAVLNDDETGRAIIDELKPELRAHLSQLVEGMLNNALKNIPLHEFRP